MKKQTILLMLLAIFLMVSTTTLLAKQISFEEFSAKTGLTIEDFEDDDDLIVIKSIVVSDLGDHYLVTIDGKSYVVNKQ